MKALMLAMALFAGCLACGAVSACDYGVAGVPQFSIVQQQVAYPVVQQFVQPYAVQQFAFAQPAFIERAPLLQLNLGRRAFVRQPFVRQRVIVRRPLVGIW